MYADNRHTISVTYMHALCDTGYGKFTRRKVILYVLLKIDIHHNPVSV